MRERSRSSKTRKPSDEKLDFMKETPRGFLKFIAVFLTSIIILSFNGCAATCLFEPAPLDAIVVSPNKIYEVRLKEQIEIKYNFWSCYGDHNVKMTVTKNQQLFIFDEVINDGDSLDGRFGRPKALWLAENVLSFYGQPNSSEFRDEIKIVNQTEKTIQYLNVGGGGRFIIFEFLPHSEVVLVTNSQTTKLSSLSWITCFGKFADNEKPFDKGVNFRVGNKDIAVTHYTIYIKDSGIEIESDDFKKLESDSSKELIPLTISSKEDKNKRK